MTPLSFLDAEGRDHRCRQRRTMPELLGITDIHDGLADLQECGFDPCTVSLLELLPIVELAWTDGEISPRDRRLLAEAAARRPGIRGRACTQLSHWLARRPPDVMFRLCRRALRGFLEQADARLAHRIRSALQSDCGLIVSGGDGLLREKIAASPAQRALLSTLARDLGLDASQPAEAP